ncbi:MAG: hypothetical protein RL062_916 [Bacteroidota bacterium]
MRKVSFLLLLAFCSLVSWGQNEPCTNAELSTPNFTDWTVVHSDTWNEVANSTTNGNSFCLPNGCFYLYGYIDPIALAQGINIQVLGQSTPIEIQYTDSTGYALGIFSWNAVSGCTEVSACNYNPNATCSDYSLCDFSCQGCTDPIASNFQPEATIDNGTCCYSQWLTLQSTDSLIFYINNGLQQYVAYGDNYSGQNNGFCFAPGCYTMSIQGLDGNPMSFEWIDANNNVVLQGNLPQGWWASFQYDNGGVNGCTQPTACNYNPLATCDDGSCDYYSCLGCTDSTASNFNPNATIDNGTCCFGTTLDVNVPSTVYWYYWNDTFSYSGMGSQSFCVNPGCGTFYAYGNNNSPFDFVLTYNDSDVVLSGNSWDPTNEWDDQATIHSQVSFGDLISGCSLPYACNYNPQANCNDYSLCDFSCQGCTDSTAFNYNPEATIDNGTCCTNNYIEITTASTQGGMVSWSAFDGFGNQIASTNFSVNTFGFCANTDCFTVNASDLLGMPFSLEIKRNGVVLYSNSNITEYNFIWTYNNNQEVGCADPGACNYNPNATCFVYDICDYSCLGCTDPSAINFNPSATIDNGTCCNAENWNTISANGSFFFVANTADYYQYSYGSYPENTGFCMNSDCFQFTAYSLTGEELQVTLSNDSTSNYAVFNTNPYLGYNTESIGLGQIPGCLDPNACNYNPTATCDAGNCLYYCGGCMDPSALNYDENVIYDDGTCYYQVEMPIVGMQMVPDANNEQFYVMMNLSDLGNAYPFMIANSQNGDLKMVNEVGSEMMGPYPCGDSIQFHIHAMGYNMNTIMTSTMYKMDCNTTGVENIALTSSWTVFPNPAQSQFQITGLSENDQILIFDMQGKLIQRWSQLATNNITINTEEWPNGLYNIQVQNGNNTTQTKVQVIH